MKYNERIREIREDNSLTQQKVANLLHIGQRTYADYESGKVRIPIDNLLILAKFYNLSMDYMIKRKFLTNRVMNSKVKFREIDSRR